MSERYPDSVVDEVLSRTDLRAVVEPYVSLKRRGGRFWGLCPFHNEKSPSFSVSTDQGLFYCFGCSEGGSAATFLMRMEGWSFPETLRHLASQAGVVLPEREARPGDEGRRAARAQYFEITEAAARYFEGNLTSGRFAVAERYLSERAVVPETTRAFRIGYATSSWDGLLRALARNKVSGADVERAGLAVSRKSGGFYDRFRDRVMFPVFDRRGRVVGFSGRVIEDKPDVAKYMNTPELPYFKKGDNLFGLQAAKRPMQKAGLAVIVEGNFDVVTLHAAGLNNVVAPLGTALTERQIRGLKRMVDTAVLVFDGDEAGRRAMLKCLEPCYSAGLAVKATLLPQGSDPDSLVREHGVAELERLIDHARPIAELAIDAAVAPAVGGPAEDRVTAARAAGEIIRLIPEQAVRRGYAEEVARRLDFTLAELRGLVRKSGSERGSQKEKSTATTAPERLEGWVRLLVQVVVDEPKLSCRLVEVSTVLESLPTWVANFVRELADAVLSPSEFRVERLIAGIELAVRPTLMEAVSAPRDYELAQCEAMYESLVWRFRTRVLGEKKAQLREQVRAAERSGDQTRFLELAREDKRLTVEQRELQRNKPRVFSASALSH